MRTGAQVNFNGIRVGEVAALGLDPNDPKQALVTISVAAGTPVRADTKVSLEFQGLTGIATLALKGGDPAAPAIERKENELPTLIAAPSASQDVMQAARDTLSRIDGLVAENQAAHQGCDQEHRDLHRDAREQFADASTASLPASTT